MSIDQSKTDHDELHFIDGTYSQSSYAVIARRGSIFLGIRFTGVLDGNLLGIPDTVYVHARLRSARSLSLAEQLDQEAETPSVVDMFEQDVTPDGAWPNIPFEKVDPERASLVIGLFIGSLAADDPSEVITHIQQGEPFRKLLAYAFRYAGQEYRIVRVVPVVNWLINQAKPALVELTSTLEEKRLREKPQKEFKGLLDDHLETVAPHLQHFTTIYQKHKHVGPPAT